MGDTCPDESCSRHSVRPTITALCNDRLIRAYQLRFLRIDLDGTPVVRGLLAECEVDNPGHVAFRLKRDGGHHREGRQWREQALRPS